MTGAVHGLGATAAMAFALPALGFALGPIFERQKWSWQFIGTVDDLHRGRLHPQGLHRDPGHRRDRPDHDLRAQAQPGDRQVPTRTSTTGSSRCPRGACTLGCPVRYVEAAARFICPCHGGVYDFAGQRIGGPPVRPLDHFYTRIADDNVEIGPRFSVNSHFSPLLAAQPRPGHGRHRQVPLPGPLLDPGQAAMKLKPPPLPLPDALQPTAQAARASRRSRPRSRSSRNRDLRRRLDRRAHRRSPAACAGCMFRKVPKGTNWFYTLGSATMFAFLSQAVTGVFLAMYYTPDPAGGAYESVVHINNDVFLGEFVHGMHKWGASVMVILDLPAHGEDVLLRRLQVPARAELGHRRRAAHPHDGHVLHGLPAALRPAVLLGHDRGHEHQRRRPDRRPVPVRLPPRRGELQRHHAVAVLRHPHAARPGLIGALIGAHLYLVAKLGTTAPPWLKAERTDGKRDEALV